MPTDLGTEAPEFSESDKVILDSLAEYGITAETLAICAGMAENALTCHMADTLTIAAKLGFDVNAMINLARRIYYADMAQLSPLLDTTLGEKDGSTDRHDGHLDQAAQTAGRDR